MEYNDEGDDMSTNKEDKEKEIKMEEDNKEEGEGKKWKREEDTREKRVRS